MAEQTAKVCHFLKNLDILGNSFKITNIASAKTESTINRPFEIYSIFKLEERIADNQLMVIKIKNNRYVTLFVKILSNFILQPNFLFMI